PHHDSDSDSTATNDSDFNWDEDEDATREQKADKTKAKRGRAIYLAFMKLARPIRFQFRDSIVYRHVYMWSLWLSIIWVASCVTYLVVDSIPRMVISLVVLFGGHVERLKIQLELTLAVSAWLKLALSISWAWIALGIIFLVEKIFLQFVAINFHPKALADRLAENRLGLKALDRLSNATPVTPKRGHGHGQRGHRNPDSSVDLGMLT
ncbi:hypothetical protein MPER_06147, partial [Moniliophthora perniciosa FA553]